MEGEEVLRVLDVLAAAGIPVSVAGGWGVDALLGRRTRDHGDLDLAVASTAIDRAIDALAAAGYALSVDQRPARLALSGALGSVDLHPVAFSPDGSGIQQGFDGQTFVYPPGSLDAVGTIAGRAVRCATPELQLRFHEGYAPRPVDRADMAALAAAFGLALPDALRD